MEAATRQLEAAPAVVNAPPDPGAPIFFPRGLLGLPEWRRFDLTTTSVEGLFWLQSVEMPELAFVLVDPFPRFEGYAVDLGPGDLADLGPCDASDLLVLTVTRLPAGASAGPTTNLRGPIAFNLRTGRAKQLAMPDPDLGVRVPVSLAL